MRERIKYQHIAKVSELANSELLLITGVSGAGKSYIGANSKETFPTLQDLDAIGREVNGKWLIDVKKIKHVEPMVCLGTADNLEDVANTMREDFEDDERIDILWIQPTPNLFRQTSAAKAVDLPKDKPESWRADHVKKSKMSDSEIKKMLKSKLDLVVVKIKLDSVYIFTNEANSEIKDGWHKEEGHEQ